MFLALGGLVADEPVVAPDVGAFGQEGTLGVDHDVQKAGGGVVVYPGGVLVLGVGDAGEVDHGEFINVGVVLGYGAVEEGAVAALAVIRLGLRDPVMVYT